MQQFLALISRLLGLEDTELAGVFLAWARVLPTLTLVPAFGLKALPAPTRVGLGIALAVAIAPALQPLAGPDGGLLRAWLLEFVLGVPVALQIAALLWAATMLGTVIDALRGAQEQLNLPILEEPASPLAVLFTLLTSLVFLESGGATRVAMRLSGLQGGVTMALPVRVTRDLLMSIEVALAVAAPILAVAVIVELAGALIARAASPASIHQLLAPVRSLALLALVALLFDRMAELFALLAERTP